MSFPVLPHEKCSSARTDLRPENKIVRKIRQIPENRILYNQ